MKNFEQLGLARLDIEDACKVNGGISVITLPPFICCYWGIGPGMDTIPIDVV
ncbi:hypothetical protein M2137_001861 [Parabacteroides sp. PFB2-10]|nr:hypothetical protein [Parabacteroides sp. PFB2-10]